MIDLTSDLAMAYADMGLNVTDGFGNPIFKVMFDESLEDLGESSLKVARTMADNIVSRGDQLTIGGKDYQVMRDSVFYGDQREELLLSLREL